MARTLFRDCLLFDGTGAPPASADIVVESGRVLDVGSGLDGDEAVDVAGMSAPQGNNRCHRRAGAALPEDALAKAEEVIDVHNESFRRGVEAGVPIAMGTDSPVTPHGQNLGELQLMEKGGMSATDALVAATGSAAELLGLEEELGTIEPGKRADIVIIDGDPLDTSGLKERIVGVYQDGELVSGPA